MVPVLEIRPACLDLSQGYHFQQLAHAGNPCCEILLTFQLNALRITSFQSVLDDYRKGRTFCVGQLG